MRIDIREDSANARRYRAIRADTGEVLDAMMFLIAVDDETGEYVRYADHGMPGHIAVDEKGDPITASGRFDFPVKLVPRR